jgi:ABC-type sugar transport system permease subunit
LFKDYYGVITSTTNFVINLTIMLLAESLILAIGLHHKDTERVLVNVILFVCLVLNSMVLPLLLQANFSTDYPGSFVDSFFSAGGRNSDFGSTWYPDICT